MNKFSTQTVALQNFAQQRDSTHGAGPEASAAYLLNLLRENYPYISTIPEDAKASDPVVMAQSSLIHYLQTLIRNLEVCADDTVLNSLAEEISLNTQATFNFIQWILNGQEPLADKIRVFNQMISIAQTCPGLAWNKHHARWSTNRLWDVGATREIRVIASPGETLNLVCEALFDVERFAETLEGDENNLNFRLKNLFEALLELQKFFELGQYNKCSAGRQHDLLWLLHNIYLDKIRSDVSAKPILMIESTKTYVLSALSDFIELQINTLMTTERNCLMLEWIKWRNNPLSTEDSPVIEFLRKKFSTLAENIDVGWQEACNEYLSQRCREKGLNPEKCDLKNMIESTETIHIFSSRDNTLLILQELMEAKWVVRRESHTSAEPTIMQRLIAGRNNALNYLKHTFNIEEWEIRAKQLEDLYVAELSFQQLIHYQDLAFFIGQDEGRFKEKIYAFMETLVVFYDGYTFEKVFLEESRMEFDNRKRLFLIAEKEFRQRSQVDFIENFFVMLQTQPVLKRHLIQRLELIGRINGRESIFVTDEMIEQWHTQNVINEDGQFVFDITPYQINRVLFHGLLYYKNGVTHNFSQALLLVIEWLLSPSRESDSTRLNEFKKNYPKYILKNLYFLTIVEKSETISASNKEFCKRLTIHEIFHLQSCFVHVFSQLTLDDKKNILSAIKYNLPQILENGFQIAKLFYLSLEQLTVEHRSEIWDVLKGNLGTMIQNVNHFILLFKLPPEKLSEAQRMEIFDVVKEKLSTMIETGDQVISLFELSLDQLSKKQRSIIANSLKNNLSVTNLGHDRFIEFLDLPLERFSKEQHTKVLRAMQNDLSKLFIVGFNFSFLFELPLEQLTKVHRKIIFNVLAGNLKNLIGRSYLLTYLFSLDIKKFTREARRFIWDSVKDHLDLLQDPTIQLVDLLKLPFSKLSKTHRKDIFNFLTSDKNTFVKLETDISMFFNLSFVQFPREQRIEFFNAHKSKLGQIIDQSKSFYYLFRLNRDKLIDEQRDFIWDIVKNRIGQLIHNQTSFFQLFELPVSELSVDRRNYIWTIIKDYLGESIEIDYYCLRKLFNLSIQQFSEEQRDDILTQLAHQFVNIFKFGYNLVLFFELLPLYLSKQNRLYILSVIWDDLYKLFSRTFELKKLFELRLEFLSLDEREWIFDALKTNFRSIFSNADEIVDFLELPVGNISEDQCLAILNGREQLLLEYFKKFGISSILKLPNCQLYPGLRIKIWSIVENKQSSVIRGFYEFHDLFKLPLACLSSEQRINILFELDDKLTIIIDQPNDLVNLFRLEIENFSQIARTYIIERLKANFDLSIINITQLFKLSMLQLTTKQRVQLWARAKNNFETTIIDMEYFIQLFELDENQLSKNQRNDIWNIVKNDFRAEHLTEQQLSRLSMLSNRQLNREARKFISERLLSLEQQGMFSERFSAFLSEPRRSPGLFEQPHLKRTRTTERISPPTSPKKSRTMSESFMCDILDQQMDVESSVPISSDTLGRPA